MDYNEIAKGMVNRHPWELSRTKMLLNFFQKYVGNKEGRYVNIGSGDCYFDKILLDKRMAKECFAVDIAYTDEFVNDNTDSRLFMVNDISGIEDGTCDFSLMMDSLEYFEDDAQFVGNLSKKVKDGGYMLFTLPAYKKLFSNHDLNVGNLRRYDVCDVEDMFAILPDIDIVAYRHFYFSLYIVRWLQVKSKSVVDPDAVVTTGWKHKEQSFISKVIVGILNLDFLFGKMLKSMGIDLPGLSLLVVARKKV